MVTSTNPSMKANIWGRALAARATSGPVPKPATLATSSV